MPSTLEDSLTVWLARLRDGRQDALKHIVPLVYDEMRRVARRQLSHERLPHALSATTLVHETYLRLLQQRRLGAMDRAGFLAIAAAAGVIGYVWPRQSASTAIAIAGVCLQWGGLAVVALGMVQSRGALYESAE